MNDNKIRHIGKLSRQGLNSLGRFSNNARGGEKKSKISFKNIKLESVVKKSKSKVKAKQKPSA